MNKKWVKETEKLLEINPRLVETYFMNQQVKALNAIVFFFAVDTVLLIILITLLWIKL